MLGAAAVAIWCDVDLKIKDEFDDWHAHEHMPERLAIPGFLRGSRWVSVDGRNSYFVLYELAAHLLHDAGAAQGAPTTEQKIRGGDQAADWIVLVNGYDIHAEALAADELDGAAPGSITRIYRLAYTLTART